MGLLLALPLAAQPADTVVVTLGDGLAEIHQRLTPEGGAVRAFAIRLEGQTLDVTEVVGEGQSLLDVVLTATEHAHELYIVSDAPISLRYVVRGSLDRIPLFVKGGRAELTVTRGVEAPYLVRIEGPADELAALDLDTSLPRFVISDAGQPEVALSSVPSLVRLSKGGPFSFTRIADSIVLILILAGMVLAWRAGRARFGTESDAA